MPTFKNVSPLGDLAVPDLSIIVAAGDEFEVPDDLAAMFAAQPANYEPADDAARAAAAAHADGLPAAAAEAEGIDEKTPDPSTVTAEAGARKRAGKPESAEEVTR